ncbi:MAG: hypothetical protein AB7S38_08590 [Vulcanimicrobiota bacterium]
MSNPVERPDLFVAPRVVHCSEHRINFMQRSNWLSFVYPFLFGLVDNGMSSVEAFEAPLITLDTSGLTGSTVLSPAELRQSVPYFKMELTNQFFLMVYGSFEALLADLIVSAYAKLGEPEPHTPARRMMIRTWADRFRLVSETFDLKLRYQNLKDWYGDVDFAVTGPDGKPYDGPLAVLKDLSEVRHLIVHFASRFDDKTAVRFGKKAGERIQIQTLFLQSVTHFLDLLAAPLDDAFSERFSWSQVEACTGALTLPPPGYPNFREA